MSMSVAAMRAAIYAVLDGRTGQDMAAVTSILTDYGNAIADYIRSNAEIVFSWNGIQPGSPPVIDPVTSATGEFTSVTITLTPSSASTYGPGMSHFSLEVSAGMAAALYNVTQGGFSISPGVYGIPPTVFSVSGDDRDAAFDDLCGQIIGWITGYVNTTPLLGTHGSFLAPPGVGAIMTAIT